VRNKVALAVSTALMSVSLSSMASIDDARQSITAITADKTKASVSNSAVQKFFFETDLAAGKYTYIVRLNDMALATYDGSIAGFAATSPRIAKKELFAKLAKSKMSSQQVRDELRLDTKSKEAVQYTNFLDSKQQEFLSQAAGTIGKNAEVVYRYKNAFNGVALRLTQAEAAQLATISGVAFVERERMEQMDTDTGPTFIGATEVWEGEGPTAINMGEGVIIGVIDSGINSDHASFADVGGDGYDHTNPWGAGVYVGDCAGDFASMCNDKLIGVRSYASVTDNYDDATIFGDTPPAKNGEDYGGHGSHTASTSGGNILKNVPLVSGDNGKAQSDGIVNEDFSFTQISGVAPHANIVAYQICNPGGTGDKYSGCPTAAIIAALDDAVKDGVDVLNYSISGGGNPWRSATELGFLAAQEAGIFSAVSAGNDGPDAFTTSKNAPWYTIVGASTHGRTLDTVVTFNDEDYKFIVGTGPVIDEVITGTPVAALNVDPANFTGCSAFAADAFKDSMALISRGGCGFLAKVTNAAAAGATSVVVYNNNAVNENEVFSMGALETTTTPSVMVSLKSGNAILADLATNPAMELTIDPAITVVHAKGDDMADFSSRGPNLTAADIMTPSVTAPGVSIYAAYADEQYGHDVTGTSPADFNFLQGTSMSAPHTSGAGAVLKSAHPTWTPDNIRSALMLTASQDVRKEDGKTDADVFDMGSGSIRVNNATNTGLIMDETFANYIKANPAVAGVPSSLNIPSMANTKCIDTCTWTRTFTATKDASWVVTANTPTTGTETAPIASKMKLTATPASFDIKAGETKTITVTADVTEADANVWNFGDITLTSAGIPDARLPVLVQAAGDNLPTQMSVVANRADGSITYSGLKSVDLTGALTAISYEAKVIEEQTLSVQERGTFDTFSITFDNLVPQAIFSTSSTEAPDADLYIIDSDGNTIGRSESSSSNERVTLNNLAAGTYTVQVQAYTPSAVGATDAVDVTVATTEFNEGSASEAVTAVLSQNATDFDITLNWTGVVNNAGLIEIKDADSSVVLPWSVTLGEADVVDNVTEELEAGVQTMTPGVAQHVAFDIAPNFTNEDKVYTLTADVTAGQEIANVDNDGVVTENTVTWSITRTVGESTETLSVGFDLIPRTASMDNEVNLTNTLGSDTIETTYSFGVVEVAPVAKITGLSTTSEGNTVTADGSTSSDANSDELTYSWVQLSGTPVSFDASAASISFEAPKVSKDETISFQLTVDDGNGNTSTASASASIVNEKSSGGSFGWLMLLLTPMLFTRRKKV
jgi:subtilisin family serine protease